MYIYICIYIYIFYTNMSKQLLFTNQRLRTEQSECNILVEILDCVQFEIAVDIY